MIHLDINAFADAHPFLTWCALWLLWGVYLLAMRALGLVIRTLRAIKVLARGWPPAHLDADGDWKPAEENRS
jgi:hypothetical protein